MTDRAAISASRNPKYLSRVLAHALFSHFAQRGRHRLAISAAAILTLIEAAQILLDATDAPGLLKTLGILTWCAAWSVSGTLREPQTPRSVLELATLRGLSEQKVKSLVPLARVQLAWAVYGLPSLALGAGLVIQSNNLSSLGVALMTTAGLGLLGLLFAVALSALCSLALTLHAARSSQVLWALLIVPALLYPALPELPSLTHLTVDFTGLLFQALAPRGTGL